MPLTAFWDGTLTGHATSAITLLNVDVNILKDLIPGGTTLSNINNANELPVYLAFNFIQSKVTTPIPRYTLTYRELVFCIPNVQLENSTDTTLYAYAPVLYLNSLQAVLGGRFFFDLAKKYASCILDMPDDPSLKIQFSAHAFLIPRDVKFKSTFEKDGSPVPTHQCPNFQLINPILQQPIIVYDRHLKFRSFQLIMEDLDSISIQPMTGYFQTGDFINGLNLDRPLQSINTSPLGTFGINYNWKLTKPRRIQ